MFNGSRFFNLLRTWEDNDEKDYISILRIVMNHYFDSIAGSANANRLIIKGYFFPDTIMHVLDSVGYHNYSLDRSSEPGVTYVTLRNTL